MKSENLKFRPAVSRSCKREMRSFCSDIKQGGGKKLDCLMEHMHHQDMGGLCQKQLLKVQDERSRNRVVDSGLTRLCANDFAAMVKAHNCSDAVTKLSPSKDSSFLGGKDKQSPAETAARIAGIILQSKPGQGAVDCLITNRKSVKSPSCRQAIVKQLRRESNDLRAKPGMWKACRDDVHTLCPTVTYGSGRLHSCMREHSAKIKNEKCLEMVIAVKKAEGEDVTISPQLRKNCVHELSTFCKGVPHGNMHRAKCLAGHFNETGFNKLCQSAVLSTMGQKFINKEWMGKRKKHSMSPREMMRWLEKNGHLKNGAGMIAGMVIGAILALAMVTACLYVITKKLRQGYAVMTPS